MNSKDKKKFNYEYDEGLKSFILPSSPINTTVSKYVPLHEQRGLQNEPILKSRYPNQSYNFSEVAKPLAITCLGVGALLIAPIPTLILAAMWQIPNMGKTKKSVEFVPTGAQIVIPRDSVKPHERRIEREKFNVHIQYEKEVYYER